MAKDGNKADRKAEKAAQKAAEKALKLAAGGGGKKGKGKAGAASTAKAVVVSPLAPASFPDLPVIDGVEFAAGAAGVKYQGRTDVMLVRLAPGTAIAGAFTKSSTRAASILDCQAKLKGVPDNSTGAAIIVNSGNANAFTGQRGAEAVQLTAAIAARVAEQRRLQDSVDKLTQQLRDSQRRGDQLSEKLEALKAIEQTLPAKPGVR